MTQVTAYQCENCGDQVSDKYDRPNWIEIDLRMISQQGGRNKERAATSLVFKRFTCEKENLMDFCNRACLVGWIQKQFPLIASKKKVKVSHVG